MITILTVVRTALPDHEMDATAWFESEDSVRSRDATEVEFSDEFLSDHGDWNDDETVWVPADLVGMAAGVLAGRVRFGTGDGFYADDYSRYPFTPGGWYADYSLHPVTADRIERTAHLSGFTPEQATAIHTAVLPREHG